MERFTHGGLFVVVPSAVAAKAALKHDARVRGTVAVRTDRRDRTAGITARPRRQPSAITPTG